MINLQQLIINVIRPTLKEINLPNLAMEQLLVGTCAQESQLGTYLKQIGEGPAKGLFQMEEATYKDCIDNYIVYRPELQKKIFNICNFIKWPESDELISNLKFATIMAAIKYLRIKEDLPNFKNIPAQANYWKKYYNTPAGKGSPQEYIKSYDSYVGNFYN